MANNKSALGRGLAAIFTDHDLEEDRQGAVGQSFEIPVTQIKTNPYQPRLDFASESLQALARSIEALGIIQPLTVRENGEAQFELISGERRLRAAKLIGLENVPAYVRTAKSAEMLEMALVENLQREDLNPVEIALGYQRLMTECGLRQAEVAKRVGMARSAVTNTLRLLRLPPQMQAALRARHISAGHGRALLALTDPTKQEKLFQSIQEEGLSVRQAEKCVEQWKKQRSVQPAPESNDTRTTLEVRDIEKRLRARFGTKAILKHRPNGGGKIELRYFSKEELERVLDILLS